MNTKPLKEPMLHQDTYTAMNPFKLGGVFSGGTGGYAGGLGKDPGDDDDEPRPGPKPPPLWKQIAVMVGIGGLTAFFETFAREAAHRLWRRAGGSLDECDHDGKQSGNGGDKYILVPVEAGDDEDDDAPDTDPPEGQRCPAIEGDKQ